MTTLRPRLSGRGALCWVMKISVKKVQNGVFAIALDDCIQTLHTHDLKRLLMESVRALTPGAMPTLSPSEEAHELGQRLMTLNAPDLQRLIILAGDEEMLVFLKGTEGDSELHNKLFTNMGERKHKILVEDLTYRFPEGVEDEVLGAANVHLIELISHLHSDDEDEGEGEAAPEENPED